MDTFKIRAVLAAAELGSLSRAAEKFSYTPSAFSHMLGAFEDELGVRIFNRSSRGVSLTEEGKRLYPDFLRIAESERNILSTVRETVENQKYKLRIATYSSISRSFLSFLIKEFSEAHPNIELYITVADRVSDFLSEDKADIVFADGNSLDGGEWTALAEDRCYAIAPIGLLGDRTEITREELYAYPHLCMDEAYMEEYFDADRFKRRIHFHSDDDLSVFHMVKQGFGIAVLPELMLRGNANGVSILSLSPALSRTIGFAYKKHAGYIFPALAQFIRYVKEKAPQILNVQNLVFN